MSVGGGPVQAHGVESLAPAVAGVIRAPGVTVPRHERIVLDNGMRLIVLPRHDVPLVSFNAILRGGECAGAAGKAGVASLVAGLLEKGAGSRNAFEFADAVEGAGGIFSAGAGPESVALRGQFLARDRELMLELLADAVRRPRFDPEEFETLRDRQIELIKAAKDSDPSELIGTYARAFLFAGHPYSRAVMGSESSLAAITSADVAEYYRAHFGADRLTLVVAGDVDPTWVKRSVVNAFGDWPRSPEPLQRLLQPVRLHQRRALLVDAPGAVQSHFWIGNVGVDRHFKDRAALDLANTLFGGRFTSMLNTELRVKSGLSYGARSGFTRGSVAGEFAIRSFAQTSELGRALELALDTLQRLKAGAVTQESLASARAYLLGQYPLEFETAADWAAALAELELFGLSAASIAEYGTELETVTLQRVQSVIERVFPSPEAVAIVMIGDAAGVASSVACYGPVQHLQLTEPDFSARAATRGNA